MNFNEDHYNSHPEYLANEKINLNAISLTNFLTAPPPEKKVQKPASSKPVSQAYAINLTSVTINQMINSLK